jgi:uncharacterized protein (DUF1697 family)
MVSAHVVLLRGVNVGSHNRIAMPRLRGALGEAGFEDVRTYLQSGNVVLRSDATPGQVERESKRCIHAEFGLEIDVVVRTAQELAEVVRRDPFGELASDHKRYQVSFLAAELKPAVAEKVAQTAAPAERVLVSSREIYAWHPEGVARSRLWALLAGRSLGVAATARNWSTVTSLLALVEEG